MATQQNNEQGKSKRGLASAPEHVRKEVASRGGKAVSQDREHMAEIGRKGGQAVSQDREHMAEIGRKGGQASRGGRTDTSETTESQEHENETPQNI